MPDLVHQMVNAEFTEILEKHNASIYETLADYLENLYDSQSINTVKEAAQAIRELSPSN